MKTKRFAFYGSLRQRCYNVKRRLKNENVVADGVVVNGLMLVAPEGRPYPYAIQHPTQHIVCTIVDVPIDVAKEIDEMERSCGYVKVDVDVPEYGICGVWVIPPINDWYKHESCR